MTRYYVGLTGSVVGQRYYSSRFKPGRAMSEGFFIFHFASLPLEIARLIYPTLCTKVAVKQQHLASIMLNHWTSRCAGNQRF